ncbi:hypothetical protein Goklo_012448, partial [Gossypium klotzschianum]|nr:hypothetical protein [Gossypium klotzschianum]
KNYSKSLASFIIFLYINLQTPSSHLIPSPFIPNLKSEEHICTADSRLVCTKFAFYGKNKQESRQKISGTYLKIMNLRMCETASKGFASQVQW